MEIWDGYYPDETLAGRDLIRGQEIPKGLVHLVCEILVIHQDGDVLVTKRADCKESYGGYYEASAGGSVLKGESVEEGACRELWEETGIKADNLKLLYKKMNKRGSAIHYGYVCITDIPKDGVVLQRGETVAYQWMSQEEFKRLMMGEKFIPSRRERLLEYMNELIS